MSKVIPVFLVSFRSVNNNITGSAVYLCCESGQMTVGDCKCRDGVQ